LANCPLLSRELRAKKGPRIRDFSQPNLRSVQGS
jgi:hypothetical protein